MRGFAYWPPETHLLATAVDLLAILAAQYKIDKPFTVPRPEPEKPKPTVREALMKLFKPKGK